MWRRDFTLKVLEKWMVQVLGIGGLFFRAKDPDRLAQWYQTHLGINPAPTQENMQPWTADGGVTVFSPFAHDTDYFPEHQSFMINFRVENLDAALAELGAEGVDNEGVVAMDGVGRFASIYDPEGNKIELWEPA